MVVSKYSLCAIRSTLTNPMSSLSAFFILQFRCQQICSLHQIRKIFGHVCSLAMVQNQTWICTQSELRSGQIWPRIRQSESTLAFCSNPTSARFSVNIRTLILSELRSDSDQVTIAIRYVPDVCCPKEALY